MGRPVSPVIQAAALALMVVLSRGTHAQDAQPNVPAATLPNAPSANSATISGMVTDTTQAAIPGAHILLEDTASQVTRSATSDAQGAFQFASIPPGNYILRINAQGFSPWKITQVIVLHEAESFLVPTVELGVEAINTTVSAITREDLAEQQITAEEHQRILGILPNFFVTYVSNAAPLTPRQKFKLALVVSVDPLTFMTTGITAGIEQAQGDFSGYGSGFSGYAQRYGAAYGDRLSATVLGAAVFPTLFHQDPRYFYRGHGRVITRALYAISTTVVCKGDNGKRQPNFSNVLGNLGAAFISGTYYPRAEQHTVQVTISNTLLGVAEGAIGTLFQEFVLRHFTHGAPPLPVQTP
jgi:hypothetical protein